MTAEEQIKEVMELVEGAMLMSENFGITNGIGNIDADYRDFAQAKFIAIESKLRNLIKDDVIVFSGPLPEDLLKDMRVCGEITLLEEGASGIEFPYKLFKDGDSWCCVGHDFISLHESDNEWGDTPEGALKAYLAMKILTNGEA